MVTEVFEKIGTRLVMDTASRRVLQDGHTIDVQKDRSGKEVFILTASSASPVQVSVLNKDVPGRHVLLMVTPSGEMTLREKKARTHKYLCGHDERRFFVAEVDSSVTTVSSAKDALKPSVVHVAEEKQGVRKKSRHKHRNEAMIRQGEWFFLPMPDMEVPQREILKNEPMRRGRSRPHIAEECYRSGGERVYVSSAFPNGLTTREYETFKAKDPRAKNMVFTSMVRNARVYVRGRIYPADRKNSDHKTRNLTCWHLVVPNEERASKTQAFLD